MTPEIDRSIDGSGAYFAAEVDVVAGRMWLHGEVDIDTAPMLDEAAEILIGGGPRTATVCLAGLDFLDAAGLASLVSLDTRLSVAGRRLELTEAQRRVARVFHCTGLGHMLEAGSRQAG